MNNWIMNSCKACGSRGELKTFEDGGMAIDCSNIMCMAGTKIIYPCGDDPMPLLVEQWDDGRNLEFPGGYITNFSQKVVDES